MEDIYHEIIMDHVHNPRNFGVLDHPTLVVKEANASCGDMIEMQFMIKNSHIADVKWRGIGCAMSTASASMISDMIIGKTVVEAKRITIDMLLHEMGLTEILPTREKCILLPLKVLEKIHE